MNNKRTKAEDDVPWTYARCRFPCCGYKCICVLPLIRKKPELECGRCGRMVVPSMDLRSDEQKRADRGAFLILLLLCSVLSILALSLLLP